MHGFMRSIGFKYISTKKELKEVLDMAVETATEEKLVSVSPEGENIVELRKYVGENIGITVHGYYNEDNEFVREYYFPFADGLIAADYETVLERHIDRTSFSGICEESRVGGSMFFYLQNGIDLVKRLLNKKHLTVHAPLSLAGLSDSGKILLPVNKNLKQIYKSKIANNNHMNLVNAAKKGDENAIADLALEDLDKYTKIAKRIHKEDLFTIVENTFMPEGLECNQYMVLGEILDIKEIKNYISGEKIYYFLLNCNDIKINVAINEEDLLGEPMVGRRFKGSIWLQGIVDFEH